MGLDVSKLRKHLGEWKKRLAAEPERARENQKQRAERQAYYQSWTEDRIRRMNADELYEYISQLWAMLIWGNKKYVVEKLIADNGLEHLTAALADLVWGKRPVAKRWNAFRASIKGMGPAMISEVLCHVHPTECALWNRRAYVGLNYLGVENLPRYDYQVTGERYADLSRIVSELAEEIRKSGIEDASLLAADYFIWDELQVEDNLSQIHKPGKHKGKPTNGKLKEPVTSDFVHNDVRDKLAEIGEWLGFKSRIEVKVADGSKVDAIWESTIGNMGRVIYVFEVQTKGSIDSLIINLLKALNNPAVQGVVAVSDAEQIKTIMKHAAPVKALSDKLRCWDYLEVVQVHEKLQTVNEAINRLQLVPQGF